jgi:Domain of unknown function (DUF4157)
VVARPLLTLLATAHLLTPLPLMKTFASGTNAGKTAVGTSPPVDNRAANPRQRRAARAASPQGPQALGNPAPPADNTTGLPDALKAGVELLSGHSLDEVQVHYNSAKPAQLQAHAYAQGTDIHVAPGQEQHLPHVSWHVVQQQQGRVRPTPQLMGNNALVDDAALEAEADIMGTRAARGAHNPTRDDVSGTEAAAPSKQRRSPGVGASS